VYDLFSFGIAQWYSGGL